MEIIGAMEDTPGANARSEEAHNTHMDAESSELENSYLQTNVGEINVKVKIVAIGQPSEAVSIFCSRNAGSRQVWDERIEEEAHRLLHMLRQLFSSDEYKVIPQNAHTCIGLKVHRHGKVWKNNHVESKGPSNTSLAIFHAIREALEQVAYTPINSRGGRRGDDVRSHMTQEEQALLRGELARIIVSAQQIDSKIENIFRALSHHGLH